MSGVLAVFAHPDDEVLAAAGTLALCAARAELVTLVCATRGEYGPISSEALATPETLADVRERELRASCAAIGCGAPSFLDLPDGGVDWAAPEQDTVAKLAALIQRERPRALITFGPDGLYGHPDHVAIGEIACEACRLVGDAAPRVFFPVWTERYVRQLLAAGGAGAQLWSLDPVRFVAREAEITASVDVRAVLERKLRAIACHATQLTEDHALSRVLQDEARARELLGVEHFRSADGLPGDPLTRH